MGDKTPNYMSRKLKIFFGEMSGTVTVLADGRDSAGGR
jgi:hypothetical protein